MVSSMLASNVMMVPETEVQATFAEPTVLFLIAVMVSLTHTMENGVITVLPTTTSLELAQQLANSTAAEESPEDPSIWLVSSPMLLHQLLSTMVHGVSLLVLRELPIMS